MRFEKLFLLFAIAAGMLASGCLFSKQALLTASADAIVPDFSGTYRSRNGDKEMVVTRKSANVFEVRAEEVFANAAEAEQAVLMPMSAPELFLLQYGNDGDYAYLVLRKMNWGVKALTFAALLEEDREANDRLEALLGKHGIMVDNALRLLDPPSPEGLTEFFNECAAEPSILAEFESWIKQ